MDFKLWALAEIDKNASNFRLQIESVVSTCYEWADGNNWEPRHTKAAIECLPVIPSIGKYPGIATEDEKKWYMELRKPDYQFMLFDAINRIKKLETQPDSVTG